MRAYGKIETSIWQKPKYRSLSADAKLLWMYVLACPHGNALGCFVLPVGYVMADLGWSEERVSKHVTELVEKCFIERDEPTSMIRICGWWGHNTIENANVAKAAVKAILALPRCVLLDRYISDLNEFPNAFRNEFANALPNGWTTGIETKEPEPEPEPEPDKRTRDTRAANVLDDEEFEVWYRAYPRHVAPGRARSAYKTARKKATAEQLLAGAEQYARQVRNAGTDPQYVKHPASWLNAECWLDESAPANGSSGNGKVDPAKIQKLIDSEKADVERGTLFLADAPFAQKDTGWLRDFLKRHPEERDQISDQARAALREGARQ